jgi:hypothetical protein
VGHRAGLDAVEKRKNLLPLPRIELWPSSLQSVAIPTELLLTKSNTLRKIYFTSTSIRGLPGVI